MLTVGRLSKAKTNFGTCIDAGTTIIKNIIMFSYIKRIEEKEEKLLKEEVEKSIYSLGKALTNVLYYGQDKEEKAEILKILLTYISKYDYGKTEEYNFNWALGEILLKNSSLSRFIKTSVAKKINAKATIKIWIIEIQIPNILSTNISTSFKY